MNKRSRRPFIVYKRNSGKKHGSYYVGLLDPSAGTYRVRKAIYGKDGRPVTHRATAETIAQEMAAEISFVAHDEKLKTYLSDFWRTDGKYAEVSLARGHALSLKYLENAQSILRVWILPFLKQSEEEEIGIQQVDPGLIENLMTWAQGKGASPRNVNAIRQAITVPLSNYWRLKGRPEKNPAAAVTKFAEGSRVREILTPDEARAFFALNWEDHRQRAINILAATTGMRLGECLGLQREDIRGDWISVCHNWQDREGLKGPKGSTAARVRSRNVPIPRVTQKALSDLVKESPWTGFVFFGYTERFPVGKKLVETGYNAALVRIGISDEERRRRGLGFHAWRHWYNSMLRGHVEDHALRALTGHKSEAMTNHYTEITSEQRSAVRKAASNLIEKPKTARRR